MNSNGFEVWYAMNHADWKSRIYWTLDLKEARAYAEKTNEDHGHYCKAYIIDCVTGRVRD